MASKFRQIFTKKQIIIALVIIVVIIVAVVVSVTLISHHKNKLAEETEETEEMEETEYDWMGERRELPVNNYSKEGFTVTRGRMHYEDEEYISVAGIDVSGYQKDIDWEKVRRDGIDFVMIRVGYRGYSEGLINADSRFEEHMEGASGAGLDIGVYFFSQAINEDEAIEEADYVLEQIEGKPVTYPVVFDLEEIAGTDRVSGLTMYEKTTIAQAFCQRIQEAGYTAMIYGNFDWMRDEYDLFELAEYPVWMAHYTYTVRSAYPYAYSIWQYSDRGEVNGIDGTVDMDIAFIPKKASEGE